MFLLREFLFLYNYLYFVYSENKYNILSFNHNVTIFEFPSIFKHTHNEFYATFTNKDIIYNCVNKLRML